MRLAYRAQHAVIREPVRRAHRIMRALTQSRISVDRSQISAIDARHDALLARDLENAERGVYPTRLLFRMPFAEYARALPRFVAELPRTALRARRKDFHDLPADVDLGAYPEYFRRNFHWQSDGYLSRRSAELYDVGVELVFMGVADVMRRQTLPAVRRHFDGLSPGRPPGPKRILDVACGAGSLLRQLAVAFPDAKLHGVDLSPHYVEVARERLRNVPDVTLVAENAESLPWRDAHFDAVVCVYLFHELPKDVRRTVLREMHRVLKPGGVLVVEDSAQYAEAADIASFLEAFSQEMHEPYYRGYLRDDLSELLAETGFAVDAVEPCFVAKVVSAHKPA